MTKIVIPGIDTQLELVAAKHDCTMPTEDFPRYDARFDLTTDGVHYQTVRKVDADSSSANPAKWAYTWMEMIYENNKKIEEKLKEEKAKQEAEQREADLIKFMESL